MLYKRPGSPYWWTRFTVRGVKVRRSTGTAVRRDAEQFEHRLRDDIWQQTHMGACQYTWDDAAARWLTEKASKRSLRRDRDVLEEFRPYLTGEPLDHIGKPTIDKLRQLLLAQKPTAATANRHLAVLRSVLNAAVGWGMINAAPRVTMFSIDTPEPRFLSRDEWDRLLQELPKHLRPPATFAVATGLRRAAVFGLKWPMVDLERGTVAVPGRLSKSGKPIPVPLNSLARSALEGALGKPPGHVFVDHRGRPMKDPKTAWAKACKRAELEGFRWHDLRHTWASWHATSGTPLMVIKELGGWSSLAMVERYAHLAETGLATWAEGVVKHKSGTVQSQVTDSTGGA